MVQHEELPHALVADTVLTGQDERVREQLLAYGADELPLDVLDRNLRKSEYSYSGHGYIHITRFVNNDLCE